MIRLTNIAMTFALAVVASFTAQAQIFYKVEKPGNDKTSYLLGTHHFANLGVVDSIPELSPALKSVDKVMGEIDMSQMTDPSVMMGMQQLLIAPPDSTLDKLLTPAQLDSLDTVWKDLTGGLAPLSMFYGMKPSVISAQISALMSQKVFPELNGIEGIDMTMQTRARDLGKSVAGFETMEFQMNMLYCRPVAEQAEDLMETVRDMPEVEKKSVELSQAYKHHDIDRILSVMQDDMDTDTAERMIYGRNDAWVKQLVEEMPEESIMVVVGAGHLPGERGVIAGLRNAGYTVTAID